MPIHGVLLDSGGVITGLQVPRPRLFARACADVGRPITEEVAREAMARAHGLYDQERDLLFGDPPAFHRRHQAVLFQAAGLGDPDRAIMERYAVLLQAKQNRIIHADVVATLEALRRDGLRLGLLSNAHSDLRKLLTFFDLWAYFDAHTISWDEGMEKPDPRFFRLALDRLGLGPGEVVHVGDDPLLDYEGARRAGLRALLLDRHGQYSGKAEPRTIPDLYSLLEALEALGDKDL